MLLAPSEGSLKAEAERRLRQRAIVNRLRERWQRAYSQQQAPGQFALAARLAKRIRRLTYLWGV